MPANLMPNLPAALRQSDLYLLEDNFAAHAIVNGRHEILQENIVVKDAYNAALLCFSHDFSLPQKLFLKFDAPDAKISTWMFPTTNLLFFGGNSMGVWIVPVSQLDAAIAVQKQIQITKRSQLAAAAEQARKNLLAKYDLNHNGIIDPDEKEAALDDPALIESELDVIDANHNGWLDAEELAYFDANGNKTLDPKEQAGIEIAQHLLAERLLKKFDANGDGLLDRSEFNDLWQSGGFRTNVPSARSFAIPFPDDNHDGKVDLGELETFLKQQTRTRLRSSGVSPDYLNQFKVDPNKSFDPRQMFKAVVESYWQNPGGVTNRTSFNRGPSVGGVVTNGTQSGKP
jgi:Ca2+-binding EF-hand superfamily protein